MLSKLVRFENLYLKKKKRNRPEEISVWYLDAVPCNILQKSALFPKNRLI